VDIFIALLAPKELVGANAIAGAMNPRVARVVNFILINWIFERLLQKDRQVCENGESKTMLSSLFLHPASRQQKKRDLHPRTCSVCTCRSLVRKGSV
jgi:hypothetical protein